VERDELARVARGAAEEAVRRHTVEFFGHLGYNIDNFDDRQKLRQDIEAAKQLRAMPDWEDDLKFARRLRLDPDFDVAFKFALNLKSTTHTVWTKILLTVLTVLTTAGAIAVLAAIGAYIRNALSK
jgi:hypothetical protein